MSSTINYELFVLFDGLIDWTDNIFVSLSFVVRFVKFVVILCYGNLLLKIKENKTTKKTMTTNFLFGSGNLKNVTQIVTNLANQLTSRW